jgi:hypothetical protein
MDPKWIQMEICMPFRSRQREREREREREISHLGISIYICDEVDHI